MPNWWICGETDFYRVIIENFTILTVEAFEGCFRPRVGLFKLDLHQGANLQYFLIYVYCTDIERL